MINSVLGLLLIVSSFSFFYYYISGRLEKQAIDNLEELTLKISNQVALVYSQLNHTSFQISQTSELQYIMLKAGQSKENKNFFALHTDAERMVQNYLSIYKNPGLNLSRISIYNDRGDYVSLGELWENTDSIRSYLLSDSFKASYLHFTEDDTIHFAGPHIDPYYPEGKQRMVSFYRVFHNEVETLGLIEFQQNVSKFEETLGVPYAGNTEVFLFDPEGRPVFTTQSGQANPNVTFHQLLGTELSDTSADINPETIIKSDLIYSFIRYPSNPWTVVLAVPKSDFLSSIKLVGRLIVIVSIAFIILSFIMNYVIAKQFTKKIRRTVNMIRQVRLGNLTIPLDHADDEMVQIHNAFNSIIDRLKTSIEAEADARSRETKARLYTLESQVNPHFLYNVLAVIGSVGEEAGADKVAELCEKLGSMFRYTLQNPDKEVTIRDEMMYAQLYLELMKVRYEDHLQYQVEIDEASLLYKVPRLIIQPLIENCFHHAFQTCNPPWEIHVTIRQTPEYGWLLEVKDRGVGFNPKVIAKLQRLDGLHDDSDGDHKSLQEESSGNHGGVGLINTIKRLKLTYGGLFSYEIAPNRPKGSIVRIGVRKATEDHLQYPSAT
ncbi:HAMP domain-containing protein [Cohnella sp. CFH 77786]|uniref:sensor histidine kinase n=1 Tax=Cohnella sp. CFH 77786 TaxID=2662265 RepID=UPI001C60B5CB|nr:sensor histidine kinase [Cohnella sp. CFH 77786]MBW5449297.1 HAMP domain-containing protein [Cohnella sp. CFH 77786]